MRIRTELARIPYQLHMNSWEIMLTSTIQRCRLLPIFFLGTMWPWWVHLGGGGGF